MLAGLWWERVAHCEPSLPQVLPKAAASTARGLILVLHLTVLLYG